MCYVCMTDFNNVRNLKNCKKLDKGHYCSLIILVNIVFCIGVQLSLSY